jgi:hypothetical protein
MKSASIIRNLSKFVLFTDLAYQDDEITVEELGRMCSMHGTHEKCIQSFDQKTRREETTWKM